MISTWFRESLYLSHEELEKAALDFVVLENCYFQKIYNRLGGLLALKRLPAITMRRGVDPEVFFQVPQWSLMGTVPGQPVEFRRGEVIHLKRGDIEQDIYGVPEYLGGMQSVLLSEDATLFRRRFYKNGAAMGYVFVTADCNFSKETSEAIEAEIKRSIGAGNFRNMYINIPKTNSRDPVKVLPIGDIKTADDYDKIKSMNMREVLAMHRMQPGIAGIIPENTSGLGDLVKARQVYWDLEVPPLQKVFLRLNDHFPMAGKIGFDTPPWTAQTAA
jgi:PBSX family phage portal protein